LLLKPVLLTGYAMPMPIVVEVQDYYAFARRARRDAAGGRSGEVIDLWDR